MDKDSFFKLFFEFNDRFRDVFPYHYFSINPFCICIEFEFIDNKLLDDLISFFSFRELDYNYSLYIKQVGIRLIFTFNVV